MIDVVVGDTKPDLSFRVRRAEIDISSDPSIVGVDFKLHNPVTGATVTIPLTLASGRWIGNFGVGDVTADLALRDDVFGELVVTFDTGPQHGREPIRVNVRPEFAQAAV